MPFCKKCKVYLPIEKFNYSLGGEQRKTVCAVCERRNGKSKPKKMPRYNKICHICGATFKGVNHSKYCSNECYLQAKSKKKNYPEVACFVCGALFTQKRSTQKYCSHECCTYANNHIIHKRPPAEGLQMTLTLNSPDYFIGLHGAKDFPELVCPFR